MEDAGPALLAATWTLSAIAILIVLLRVFTRLRISKAFGIDDWTMVIGTGFNLLYSALITAAALTGTGKHITDLERTKTPAQLEHCLLLLVVCEGVSVHSFTVTKVSVAFLLIRVFNPRNWIKAALLFLPIVLICIAIATTFVVFFMCDPIRGQWTPQLIPTTVCWNPIILESCGYTLAALAAAIDIIFGIYPLVILFKLQMPLRKQAGLAVLFAAGLVAAAFSIYKATFLPALGKHEDVTYDIVGLLLWTSVESNIIILAACAPTLIPLFRLAYERRQPTRGSGSESRQYRNLEASNQKRTTGSTPARRGNQTDDMKTEISLNTFEKDSSADDSDSHAYSLPEDDLVTAQHYGKTQGSGKDDILITRTYDVSRDPSAIASPDAAPYTGPNYSNPVPSNLRSSGGYDTPHHRKT